MAQYRKLSSFGNKSDEMNEKGESFIDIINIKTIQEKKMLIENNKICVFYIYGDWCGPCKIASPLFIELSKKYNISGVCFLAKENVDLRLSPSIQVVPTFEFYFNGKMDSLITGADVTSVEEKIIEFLSFEQKEQPSTKQPVEPKNTQEDNQPPQMQKQFQYQYQPQKEKEKETTQQQQLMSEQFIPKQSSNEGYQHLNQSRQQHYEKPANLPMPLPIRRKI